MITFSNIQLALPWSFKPLLALPWYSSEGEGGEGGDDGDEELEVEMSELGEGEGEEEYEDEGEAEGEEIEEVEEEWEFKPDAYNFRSFTNNNRHFHIWDNTSDMLRRINPNDYICKQYRTDINGKGKYPYGGRDQPTLDSFLLDTKNVWKEGIDRVEECLQELRDIEIVGLRDHRRRIRFKEDVGDDLEYDRFRTGQPDYWRSSEREDCQGPNEVTIFVDLTTPYMYEPDEILWRGAVSIALAEILEEKGLRTEIWLTHGFRPNVFKEDTHLFACCLKRTGDPLDRSTLINSTSAWFYRHGMFALEVTLGLRKRGKTNYCETPTQEELDKISTDQQRIYCSGVFSKHAAIRLIQSEVEKIASHKHQGA